MALRNIREIGDPVLTKRAKEVTEMTDRLRELINDMKDTLYDAQGVGLAAPQVGVLKRIVLIDVSEEQNDLHVLINPVLVETSGEQEGIVKRPSYAKAVALDENMQPTEIEGTDLLARAICHELDHLDGNLYVRLVEGELEDARPADEEEE